ncbi:MAG: tRNA preQ1(34) S-adenosylmethionine ribosyltransferase-isomerase QueA [Gammaproteobacteria bacterium]|nr:tRNA preQ1(34) S-adenosylmethionine ribosyltransferase-isomerase QueA [Gammaproteobacteria bacterium]
MKSSDFDFKLPERLIAQRPLPERQASRLLVLDPQEASYQDHQFTHFDQFLQAGDLLVFNDTQVFPARLFGQKHTGGKVEILVERILDEKTLLAHVRASKSPRPGTILTLENKIECEVIRRDDDLFILEQESNTHWLDLLQDYGHMPLPPYIQRADEENDRQRYQTVYARQPGAVAAPTAGLHFDDDMLQRLQQKGVQQAYITLHVGAGTFQPVRVDNVAEHVMHAEWIDVPDSVCETIRRTHENGGRVVAVGTTVVRSLESAAQNGALKSFQGDTRLFITPGFKFQVVDAMLTNFHLPKSTLLMLVSAFAGKKFILDAYQHAVEQGYRFFSYGDAMLIKNRCESFNTN